MFRTDLHKMGVDVSDYEAADLSIPVKRTLEAHEKKNLHILQKVVRCKFFPDQDEMIYHRGNEAFISGPHSDTTISHDSKRSSLGQTNSKGSFLLDI